MSKVRDNILWLAGILEGEGCFSLSRNTPRVTVNMTDEDVIKRIAEMFSVTYREVKGNVRAKHSNWKPCYNVTVNGETAIGIMFSVYSLMSNRRKAKIKDIVEKWKQVPRRSPLTQCIANQIRKDFECKASIKDLVTKYKVNYHAIWNIIHNRTWKD